MPTLPEIFDRTHTGEKTYGCKSCQLCQKYFTGPILEKKYIGAKAGREVTISVKTFQLSGKYSTGPILQKKYKGAKAVTRASVAETPQIMFLEIANFVGNICQVVTKALPEIFDRTHTEEKT